MPWLTREFEAFFELSTCRVDGGPIPWTAIYQYAAVNGFADTHADYYRFVRLIRAMDSVYVKHLRDKQEAQMKKNAPKKTSKGKS
jgi:hypothetical protein